MSDESERDRLRLLYAGTRGMLVDGTGWPGRQDDLAASVDDRDLVRPFGLIGPTYRANAFGSFFYSFGLVFSAIAVALNLWAKEFRPSLQPRLFAGSLLVVVALNALTVLNSERVPKSD